MIHLVDLDAIQRSRLLLDLSQVRHLDQTGLDAVLRLETDVIDAGGTMELMDRTVELIWLLHQAVLCSR